MSLSVPQIEEKVFYEVSWLAKKLSFKYLCFQRFNTWLFYSAEGVKSQLKLFCLVQKKSFEAVFRGLRL